MWVIVTLNLKVELNVAGLGLGLQVYNSWLRVLGHELGDLGGLGNPKPRFKVDRLQHTVILFVRTPTKGPVNGGNPLLRFADLRQ